MGSMAMVRSDRHGRSGAERDYDVADPCRKIPARLRYNPAMSIEIERRFLVAQDTWRSAVTATHRLDQGYLAREDGVVVRIRASDAAAWLTIKGPGGMVRPEYEYALPLADAAAMLDTLCAGRRIAKTRHIVPHDGLTWEIDVFEGPLAGLVIAEVELPSTDRPVSPPPWAGREITGDHRYANAVLASATSPPRG